jgi:hypothetical protein
VAVKRLIEWLGKDKMEGKKAEGVKDLRWLEFSIYGN